MRHVWVLVVAAGCGFHARAGGSPDAAPIPDGGVAATWMFTTAADFGAAGHAVQAMTIEPRGSLTPDAYTYGGLAAHGLPGQKLWAHGNISWANLDGKSAMGAGLWRGEALPSGTRLDYLGITTGTVLTVWLEGEVWLDAGSTESFGLDADDVAFIQLARPGTASYAPIMENGTPAAVATPDTGWYPIRIGYANDNGGTSFNFTHADTGGARVAWTRDRLRARASELPGALRTVFGREIFAGGLAGLAPISHIEDGALLPLTMFGTPLQGAGAEDWSARYAGQVYIAQPGMYTLRINSDDGSRGRLATQRGETSWSRDGQAGDANTTAAAMLVAGWNDLTVDYNQTRGMSKLGVQLDGPDFSNIPVPHDRLRAVEPGDDRLVFTSDSTGHAIVDNGGSGNPGTAALKIAGYPGETVAAIDVSYELSTQHWNELKVDLESPTARVTIADIGGGDADQIAEISISATSAPALTALLGPANGDWKLHVYDVHPGGGDSLLKNAQLTLHTTGGPEKIARASSWTSQVLTAPASVFVIDGVTWDARLPAGTGLEVHVRTCQRADCSDGTWSGAVTPAMAFPVTPAPYLQLRVDLTSDGTVEPELRSLSVAYRHD